MSNEENVDECVQDPVEKFKVETVLGSLDVILSNHDQYFNDTTIGVMKDIALFSVTFRIIEIKKTRILYQIYSFLWSLRNVC